MKASIQISTETIKVISYTKSGQRISVKDYFTYPLPDQRDTVIEIVLKQPQV